MAVLLSTLMSCHEGRPKRCARPAALDAGVVAEAEAAVEAEPPSPASVATSNHELSPRGSSSEKHGSFLGGIFK